MEIFAYFFFFFFFWFYGVYSPKFESQRISATVREFATFDPNNFSSHDSEDDNTRISLANQIDDDDDNTLTEAQKNEMKNNDPLVERSLREARKQSNMSSIINSTLQSISEIEDKRRYSLLDAQSFIRAFEDYSAHATKCETGFPIGMNVKSLNRYDICKGIR